MRMSTLHFYVSIFLLLSLGACGKEMGRLHFSAVGSAESLMTLEAGEVALWTEIDIEHTGYAELGYEVTMLQEGRTVATMSCNPLGKVRTKVGWVQTYFGEKYSRSGTGKMSCTAQLKKGGPTTIRADLRFGKAPKSFLLRKAHLIVRQ